VAFTALLTVVALVLFYAGETTSLLGVYGEQFERSGRYARVAAGFATPPLLGSWCIVMAAIVAWPRAGLPWRRTVIAQVALVGVAAATLSRPLLGVLAVLVVQWAARVPSRVRIRLAASFVIGAVLALAVLTVGRLHVDPTRPLEASYVVPDPGNRREAAETSWHTLRERPIVGKGPGSYPGTNRGQPFRAHLTPLNIAATLGIPALAAITGFVLALWRRRERPTDVALWSGAVGLALDALAQDIEHFRHVWLLIGLLMAGAAHSRRGTERRIGESPPPAARTRGRRRRDSAYDILGRPRA
jgi:small-conductance mechanosensitive channel